jgi:hypothetical protein
MQALVSENVLDQFNLYRTLAGMPNVTLNVTKSTDAQAAAWWDAALSTSFTPRSCSAPTPGTHFHWMAFGLPVQAGGCDPNNLELCWANTSSPCYTEGRQMLASNIHLHQVRLGGTYFDVASILEATSYDVGA